MVIFMQDYACVEALECFCFLNEIFITVLNGDGTFTADFFPEPRQAQAAFIARPWRAIKGCNMGIDEDGFSACFSLKLFALFFVTAVVYVLSIEHKQADRPVDLWRCQAHAMGIVHGFPHVIQ